MTALIQSCTHCRSWLDSRAPSAMSDFRLWLRRGIERGRPWMAQCCGRPSSTASECDRRRACSVKTRVTALDITCGGMEFPDWSSAVHACRPCTDDGPTTSFLFFRSAEKQTHAVRCPSIPSSLAPSQRFPPWPPQVCVCGCRDLGEERVRSGVSRGTCVSNGWGTSRHELHDQGPGFGSAGPS